MYCQKNKEYLLKHVVVLENQMNRVLLMDSVSRIIHDEHFSVRHLCSTLGKQELTISHFPCHSSLEYNNNISIYFLGVLQSEKHVTM